MALSPAVSVHSILLGLGDRRLLSIWRCTSTAQVYRCGGYFDAFAVGAAISMRRASLYCPVAVVSPHLILSRQRPERQGLCEPNSQSTDPGAFPVFIPTSSLLINQSINQAIVILSSHLSLRRCTLIHHVIATQPALRGSQGCRSNY